MEFAAPSFSDCRSAARSIRATDRWHIVQDSLRPRVLSWFRSRAPLTLLIHRGGRDGYLLWESPDSLILLDPPAREMRRSWLDRWWDALALFIPAVAFFCAAVVVVAIGGPLKVQLSLVFATILWPALFWMVGMAADIVRFTREFFRWPTGDEHLAQVDRVLDANWSIILCHIKGPGDVGRAIPALPGSADPVLIRSEAVTTEDTLAAWKAAPQTRLLDAAGAVLVLVRGPNRRVREQPVKIAPHAAMTLATMLGVVVLVATGARVVASAEQTACVGACTDRPTTYWTAVYWLLNRLSGGDPNGLGAATVWGRFVGLLVTAASFFFVAVLAKVLADRFLDLRRPLAAEAAAVFNKSLAAETSSDVTTSDSSHPPSPPDDSRAVLSELETTRSLRPSQLARLAVAFAAGVGATAIVLAATRQRSRTPRSNGRR